MLVFSGLYPSSVRARHGIFVETRLRKLLALGGIEARVIAPVPWFPSASERFGAYASYAATPRHETRFGIPVSYPRYLVIPKVGMHLQPAALAWTVAREARELERQGFDSDVIDAHYFYPDAVAAADIAQRLGKPFVITARGSDLNLIAQSSRARSRIVDAAKRAARVICVSSSLRDRAVEIGIPADRVEVLRNGVDTDVFRPLDRTQSRRDIGVPTDATLLLAVGNLVPDKDLRLAIDLLPKFAGARMLMIGDGPEHARLLRHAHRLGVQSRLTILPPVPQPQLARFYSAADVLLLTSVREGWPNVVLESMACGTPVAAVNVGGVAEIVGASSAGRVVDTRSPDALAEAVRHLLRQPGRREAAREHALGFGWRVVAERYRDVLCNATRAPR